MAAVRLAKPETEQDIGGRAVTPHEIELAIALHGCGWVGARFIRNMATLAGSEPGAEINLRQRHYMEILAWRYRRQLSDHLVPESKPLNLPRRRKEQKPKPERIAEPDLFGNAL